ncbi:hypothetical protein HZU40_20195 [Mycolicibacterium fluoranthenivorans]|uniref:Uncharacterized protein n=1 Tax=Mycolicibacterium fluoranthenivorans TaxID=258505 RepID=A0A7G8P8B3_9MYCO|nr:hypothetical protein [Mycolicibacterium fluoranthenivorans]QNJ90579.1 hypothetical protein HZU40_20195 [Mycolicibacterium fluoranthenivorans]
MAFKKVKVNFHHIKNENTGDDSGDQLEIFGRFDVARLVFDPDIGEILSFDNQNLFDVSSDNAIDLEQGAAFVVDRSAVLTINDGEILQITGHVLDEDDTFGGSDDDMGTLDARFNLGEISNGLVSIGNFQESDQIVSVKMSFQILAQG